MKRLKKILKWLLIILVVLNLAIIVTGRTYLYKGIWNTYLKGRTGPGIFEYEIFENRKVAAGNYQPWPIAVDYNKKEISSKYQGRFKELGTVSYVIIKNDSLRYEGYWDGGSENSATNSFSVAKTIVSILVGAAIQEGKIKSVDQHVSEFLPQFKEGDNAKLTIRHLLTMSSGINFDEDYVSPFAYPAQAYYGSDLEDLTCSYKVTEEPGRTFRYLSGNTVILGLIIQKATGKTISDYASEKLWKPLGAKNDAWWSLDKADGLEKAYCCFNTNARDFARIGQLYLDSGSWKGKQIVPLDYVRESLKPADTKRANGEKNEIYGYQWWLMKHNGQNVFYARGILGQYIIVIPEERMVIVRLGTKRESTPGPDHPADAADYIDAAMEMYQ